MTLLGRDAVEVEALVTDRYLDALLAGADRPAGLEAGRRGRGRAAGRRLPADPLEALDASVRLASRRLTSDLPRFHPSFRFEERLALRLAEAAATMRLPVAAGSEGSVVPISLEARRAGPRPGDRENADGAAPGTFDPLADPLADPLDDELAGIPRPLLIGGAVAASALSLAGAAWIAWRRVRPGSPMARAARAAHAARPLAAERPA